MKNQALYLSVILSFTFILVSCTGEGGLFGGDEFHIDGCTDPLSFNYNADATRNDGSCVEMQGCLGFAGGLPNSGRLSNTLGDARYDRKMSEEVAGQRRFFNVPADVYILIEPSPEHRNAYATSDGRILFGYHMHNYTIRKYGELPVAGILAHEWGHRVQFQHNWRYSRPEYKELEADAFSGFYMGLAKRWAWDQIQNYYANVYATGDYNFNSRQHHGTPRERVNAAYLGVRTAVYAMQHQKQFTYQELHQLFIDALENEVAPRSEEHRYPEIAYPDGLTEAEIEGLFPRE